MYYIFGMDLTTYGIHLNSAIPIINGTRAEYGVMKWSLHSTESEWFQKESLHMRKA